jgi:uncharacterized membrane protein YjdF
MKKVLEMVIRDFKPEDQESITEKIQFSIYIIVQMSFVVALFMAIFERAWLTVFVSIAALVAVRLPSILARNIRVYLPVEFLFLLAVFIYGSFFLGEIHGFYTLFWWWDVVLHASSGLALGFIGFLILYSLHRENRLSMSPALLAFFSFTFALALGALWEIFEFSMDSLLGFNMQKTMLGDTSGLTDTMWDMIANTAGALIASTTGYLYLRRKKGVGIFEFYLSVYFERNK